MAWNEIKSNYTYTDNSNNYVIHIDAWKTPNQNEEGRTIVKVYGLNDGTIDIKYNDDNAKTDKKAQELVMQSIVSLLARGYILD